MIMSLIGVPALMKTSPSALAQPPATSSSSSLSSTSDNSTYKFERGYPAPGTAERAYNDTDLSRAINAYKFFYPTVSVESLFQDLASVLKPNQSAAKFHAGPQIQLLTGNGDTPYGSGRLDLDATGPIVFELPPNKFIGFANDHNFRWIVTWA
jgi:hypothetical protein